MSKNLPLRFTINRIGEPNLTEYGASRTALDNPGAVREFWRAVIESRPDHEPDKEHLVVILVNTIYRPTGYHVVSVGSLNETVAHPREIFRPVIISAAFGFILAHNHPSGNTIPSGADRSVTSKARDAANLLQIQMLDHVIIGLPEDGRPPYFSFREAGLL